MKLLSASRISLLGLILAVPIAFAQNAPIHADKPPKPPKVRYMVVDLGTDGSANEILQSGKIIGSLNHGDPDRHATFWRNELSAGIDLGILPDATGSRGAAGNEKGQVVGEDFVGDTLTRAIVWDNKSGPVLLSGVPQVFDVASDINEAGRIVGQSFSPDTGIASAVYWPNSKTPATFLPTTPAFPNAFAVCINQGGNILGVVISADFTQGGVAYWDKNTSKPVMLAPPGGNFGGTSLGFSSGLFVAHSLSNSKQIVAYAFNPNSQTFATEAVYWERSSSPAKVLPFDSSDFPNAMAECVGDDGQIVGTAYSSDLLTSHGCIGRRLTARVST